ncbi:hypothetical protein [Streptomyces orinoci]|uniref:Secreted protein n=1 Tax=Streptomyces orinoci TaxID=67339 RepID=A0ABV3JXH1_STRON|nr:hypothetical protein [Streptomyces orinoci]
MDEPVVIRSLAAAAAAAAVVGSVLMRRWDRAAGKRVAQLTAARVRDEWKTDERIAELETDLDETRQARTRLEAKLRGKRAELARLRTEHADLLRRYATAETERASALEGRRLLASGREKEKAGVPRAALALESAIQARSERQARSGGDLSPAAYRLAAAALRDLAANGVRQRAAASSADAEPTASERQVASAPAAVEGASAQSGPAGSGAAPSEAAPSGAARSEAAESRASESRASEERSARSQPSSAEAARSGADEASAAQSPAEEAAPAGAPAVDAAAAEAQAGAQAMDKAPVPTVKAPAPVAQAAPGAARSGAGTTPGGLVRRPVPSVPVARTQGGFDFFGNNRKPVVPAAPPVEEQDLADVVGEEALAQDAAGAADSADGEVIDLTAHDDTEQIDVIELRNAI